MYFDKHVYLLEDFNLKRTDQINLHLIGRIEATRVLQSAYFFATSHSVRTLPVIT